MQFYLEITTNLSKGSITGEINSLLIDTISKYLNKPKEYFAANFLSGLKLCKNFEFQKLN